MRLLTTTLGLALAAIALFVAVGAAATLAVSSTSLAAGNGTVSSCGVSSLTAARSVDNSGNITRVDVAAIPAACSGEKLTVTLTGSGNAALASGTGTIGSCATTCSAAVTSLSSSVAASNVLGFAFAVQG